ncbi:MAG: BrnA antitoxin family protein [Roseiflexus sp.]|nr:BrnA antitoxin family protein [Roseiflexus sp.]
MSESEEPQLTSISKGQTIDEIAEFWETHSLADYWDQTREVVFEVRAQRTWRVALDPEIYAQLKAQARRRGITPETLVNLWLLERLSKQSAETGHVEATTTRQ